ncbi:MAG: hypothetical protein FWC79_06435 [Oscillospiraceae bacterium]|nr:hypothetical protein [Oscillospiraceae bacterium]
MAMIKCSKCNKETSDKTKVCADCGNSIKETRISLQGVRNSNFIIPILCIINIILMFQATMRISFTSIINVVDYEGVSSFGEMNLTIFNANYVFRDLGHFLGISSDNFYITVFYILAYVSYAIIVGFVISTILFIMKKEIKIIPFISSIFGIIINIGFIIYSFSVNDFMRSEELSESGSFSVTMFPYLIIVVSSIIVFKVLRIMLKMRCKTT